MFRIQENSDGTTSIFCKNSGNLVCKIPTKGNSNCHRPVNVVEPQLANEAPSRGNWPQLKSSEDLDILQEDKDDSPLNRSLEEVCVSNASQDQFAKYLDLVPTEEFHSCPRSTLFAEWPLRQLSRSSSFRTAENVLLKDMKVPDHLPLTSSFGFRLLQENQTRHFASKERVSASLRSYESFCRHPYNTVRPSSCSFPKLRCRGEKTYPVQTPSRVFRHLQTAHIYSIGKRQREERKTTLRTGLNRRSRRLLQMCNTRYCTVDIVRLPQDVIDDWTSRITTIEISDSDDDSDPEYYVPRSRLPPSRCKPQLRSRGQESCSVKLTNVLMDIQRVGDTHYVRNTNIKVPFYNDFLASLKVDKPLLNSIYEANGIIPKQSGKPAQRPSSTVKHRNSVVVGSNSSSTAKHRSSAMGGKLVGSNPSSTAKHKNSAMGGKLVGSNNPSSTAKHKNSVVVGGKLVGSNSTSNAIQTYSRFPNSTFKLKSNSMVSNQGAGTSALKPIKKPAQRLTLKPKLVQRPMGIKKESNEPIPVIDLTEETTPPKLEPAHVLSRYRFHCFACGLRRAFFEERKKVEREVRSHMSNFHAASNAEPFLARYLDSVNHCAVIEAFPGYKDDDD